MTSLRNPYMSVQSQKFLIKKNYNVIKSPNKQPLYPGYNNNSSRVSYQNYRKNQQSTLKSSFVSAKFNNQSNKNIFSGNKILGEKNQNLGPLQRINNVYTANLPSFYTQPYLPSLQKAQLPFPSYNRPQTHRSSSRSLNKVSHQLAFSRRNNAILNGQTTSLEKQSGVYRPHFVSPLKNNDWNTQKWRKQLQFEQREKLRKYGPEAMRFQHKKFTPQFNNQYYSLKQLDDKKYTYKINSQKNVSKPNKQKELFDSDQYQNKKQKKYENKNSLKSLDVPKNPDGLNINYQNKKPSKHKSSNNRVSFNQNDGHHEYKLEEQSQSQIQNFDNKIQNFNYGSNSNLMKNSKHMLNQSSVMLDDYKSFVKDQEQSNFGEKRYESKYENNWGKKNNNRGPLDFDAFDESRVENQQDRYNNKNTDKDDYHMNRMLDSKSVRNDISAKFGNVQSRVKYRQEQSDVFNNDQKYYESKNSFGEGRRYGLQKKVTKPQKDYPQAIKYNNQVYYRLKV